MQNPNNAVKVLQAAAKVAKTPEESRMVDNSLMRAQGYAETQARFAEQKRRMDEQGKGTDGAEVTTTVTNTTIPQLKKRPEFVAKGPHRFVVGVLKSVHCDTPALDLTVNASGKLVAVHVDNYFKVPFTTLGFQATGELNPCSDLENRPAKVEYVESANPSVTAQLISIELHK